MTLLPVVLIAISAFLHAGWNLLAHSRRSDGALFLHISITTGAVGLVPAILGELHAPFPAHVWGLLILTGAFEALYYLGLTMGYRSGEFTVVYPLARALPVLLLVVVDLARGRVPSPLGWAGMALVVSGCALAPLTSLRTASLASYRNRAMLWVIVTALGTVGYTTVDKIAAEALAPGPLTAARYAIWEAVTTVPFLWLALKWIGKRANPAGSRESWAWAITAALFVFGAYSLVLWAYQLSPYASYVNALRQLSIVIGVVAAIVMLRQPAPRLRILAAGVITIGIILISVAAT
ncbi:MAG: GRP family sugar transporter [Chloroflexi bacterium]|nr:GRP family sugar transporter [Chloroflexota bacterium]